MAVDLALLGGVADGSAGVLRTYDWSEPTVSFGRNEPVRGVWDVDAMRAAGLGVVRRPTGGRALLHEHEATWSVCLPIADSVPWRSVYAEVNARLCGALQALGIPAAVHARAEQPESSEALPGTQRGLMPDLARGLDGAREPGLALGATCFAAPSVGELVVNGAKIAGSAVWRSAGAYLQHGSILLQDGQDALSRFRGASHATGPAVPTATVAAWLPTHSLAQMRARVHAALHTAWSAPGSAVDGAAARSAEMLETEQRACVEARTLLVSDAWLWRR